MNRPRNLTACRTEVILLSLVSGIFLFASGCALFGGGGNEIKRSTGYQVSMPKDWAVADSKGESDKAYQLPSGALATLTSYCNRPPTSSLEVLTKQLLIGSRNIVIEKREHLLVNGTDGLLSNIRAFYEGVPFHLELFVIPKDSCVFDFTLMSPKGISDSESQEFIAFIKSFSYGTN